MRKSIIGAVVLGTALVGVGYTVGQFQGPTPSSAATAAPTPSTAAPQDGARPFGGHFGQMGPRADGTVTAINGNNITVKADSDQGQTGEYGNVTTVVLTGSTTYEADHDSTATASKSSIKVGSYLIAEGTLSADGKTLTATTAAVHGNGPDAGPAGTSNAPGT